MHAHWIERYTERCPEWTVICEHGQTTSEEMAEKQGRDGLAVWLAAFRSFVMPFLSPPKDRWTLLLILTLMANQHADDYGCPCATAQAPDLWLAA